MTNEISIGISFANLPSDVDCAPIRKFILDNGDGYELYTLAPAKPGYMRAAAFDIMLVLYATGSAASLATLLWMAYDKFIAPKKSKETDSAGIYIGIRHPDDKVSEFWIGNTHKRREIFVKEFESKVTTIRQQDDEGFWEESVTEIRESEIWIRE
jgi:hypothetical protein